MEGFIDMYLVSFMQPWAMMAKIISTAPVRIKVREVFRTPLLVISGK
jgi:hypothetical protein